MPKEQAKVFLDASIFMAAVRSPSGGSALVLEVCRGGKFRAISTRKVLLEAQGNIKRKFSEEELIKFYREIVTLKLETTEPAIEEEIAEYSQLIEQKDAHVLAAAIKSGAAFLITLDQKHFMTYVIKQAKLPISILTPGEFLRGICKI